MLLNGATIICVIVENINHFLEPPGLAHWLQMRFVSASHHIKLSLSAIKHWLTFTETVQEISASRRPPWRIITEDQLRIEIGRELYWMNWFAEYIFCMTNVKLFSCFYEIVDFLPKTGILRFRDNVMLHDIQSKFGYLWARPSISTL